MLLGYLAETSGENQGKWVQGKLSFIGRVVLNFGKQLEKWQKNKEIRSFSIIHYSEKHQQFGIINLSWCLRQTHQLMSQF